MIKLYEKNYKLSRQWKNCRIMVVDEEEFYIAAMKALLEVIGLDSKYIVDFCINGQEAVDMI